MQQENEEPIPLLPRTTNATASTSSPRPRGSFDSTHSLPKSAKDATSFDDDEETIAPTPSVSRRARRGIGSPSLQGTLYNLLEVPTSSPSAFTVHLAVNALIGLSALLTVLETLPFFHHVKPGVWFGLETMIVVIFTVEYIARCIAWSESFKTWWGWSTSFFGIIDLLAILPYYIEIALQADTTAFFRFSILRVFRLLRVFRPFRYSNTILLTIEVMIISMRRSQDALLALAFFVIMALVVFSTLLYFAERGTWDEVLENFVDEDGVKSQFDSIPAAAWFVLVTMTTVGYGEIIPRSLLGRLITVPLLLFGLLLIALPSFVLGREFAVVWEEMGSGVIRSLRRTQHPNDSVVFDSNQHDEEDPLDHPPMTAPIGGSLHHRGTNRGDVERELRLLRQEREEVTKLLVELKSELKSLKQLNSSTS